MEHKAKLLELLEKAYEEEKAYVVGLTEEERSRVGTLEQWSAKEVIAHNAAWKKRMAENLLAVSQGRAPQRTEDYNRENELLFEEHRSKTWEEVKELAEEAYRALMERVAGLGEEELSSSEVLPWQEGNPLWRLIAGNGGNHPFIHLSGYYQKRGQTQRAALLIGKMARSGADLDASPIWQGVVRYNLACHYSLMEQKQKAIAELREALQLNPGLEDWSKQDPDLEPIRGEPEYQLIYEG